MIRDFFRKHRVVKYAGLTLGLAVICTGVFFALHVGGVKAENEDYKMSYVPGETAAPKTSQIVVTSV